MLDSCNSTKPYVVGVGAANVDIHGKSRAAIILRDSNPGHMHASPGGVTRNVCENLARLGADVRLITAVGRDVYADMIRKECADAGIDLSQVFTADHPSSTYISILDEQGDMFLAMSDMRVLSLLTPDYLLQRRDLLQNASLVTTDPALHPDTMACLLDICQGHTPVYVDPVSSAYANVIKPHIGKFHTAKPNAMELAILSGVEITDRSSLLKAGETVLKTGLHRLLISMGKDGCLYMDDQGTILTRKLRPLEQMVNATGAGDAFMAASIYGTLQGYGIEQTLDCALAAGIAAVSHEKTINPHMSPVLIENIIKEYTP